MINPMMHNPARMRGLRAAPPTSPDQLGERPAFNEGEARQTAGTLRRARETQGRAMLNQIRGAYQRAQQSGDFTEYNSLVASRKGFQTDAGGNVATDENGTPLANEFGKMGDQIQDISRGLRPELTEEKLDQDRAHLGGMLQRSRRQSAAMARERAGQIGEQIGEAKREYGDRHMGAEGYDLPGERALSGPSLQQDLTAPGLYDAASPAERARFGFDRVPGLTSQRDQLQTQAANMEDAAQFGELMARDGEQVFPASTVDVSGANRRRNDARARAAAAQGERMEREQLDASGRAAIRTVEGAGQETVLSTAEAARIRAEAERIRAAADQDTAGADAVGARMGRTIAETTEGDRTASAIELTQLEDRLAKAQTGAELEKALADGAESINRRVDAELAKQQLSVGDPGNVLMARAPEVIGKAMTDGVDQIVAAFTKNGSQQGENAGLVKFKAVPISQISSLKTIWLPKLLEGYESPDPAVRQAAMDVATAVYGQLESLREQTGSGSFEGRRTVGFLSELFRGRDAFDVSAPDSGRTRAGERSIADLNAMTDTLGLIAQGLKTPGTVRNTQARRAAAASVGAN